MAIIEVGSGSNYLEQSLGMSPLLRRPLFPTIRWSAIFAGVAVGLSVQLALALLGLATGLSAMDVTQGATPNASGPLLWAGFCMLLSAFIGGYVAARMSGLKRKVDGVLHGAVAWAVTTLLFATLATSVTGSLLSNIFDTVGPNVARSSVANGSALGAMLRGQLGPNVDSATLQSLQRDIQAGRRTDAIELMTGSLGITRSRAETIADQALILAGNPNQASPQSRAAVERAVDTAGTAAWIVFLAVALSLAAGVGGGVLGAIGARRTTWASSSSASTPTDTSSRPA